MTTKPKCVRCVSVPKNGVAGGVLPALKHLGVRPPWKRSHCLRSQRGLLWWKRPDVSSESLVLCLRSAYCAYRKQAKAVHPDHNGGRAEWDVLNRAWQTVKRTFDRRGYRL